MKSKTNLLTLDDKIYKVFKAQHTQFKPILNIHRLIVLKHLSLCQQTFKNIKLLCATTDGNTASIMKAMEDQELIKVIKEFENKYPKTSYVLTDKGKKLYKDLSKYLYDLLGTSHLSFGVN